MLRIPLALVAMLTLTGCSGIAGPDGYRQDDEGIWVYEDPSSDPLGAENPVPGDTDEGN